MPIPKRGEWQGCGATCAYNEADGKIMSKSSLPFVLSGLALLGAASIATPVTAGATANCTPGKPSVLVHVAGFKQPAGEVKVSLYGADTSRWLV